MNRVHRDLGLTDEEFESILGLLSREPSYTELAMFSVMWSEHCSYKSSKVHLQTLPTTGEHVLVGPGEGAGIVEVAPGVAVAWKIESHNHPSFVEPFNGAATGIGGIVRDILSMGARPLALLDPLRFGSFDYARTSYLVDGVISGISSYGNSIGVPTVGGELIFDDCYSENPLVNVACLGLVEQKLMHGRAEGGGNQVLLIGSSTGRDGIGGASVLASAEFDEASSEKRPAVQVGDPFTEKLLIEACLELIQRDLLVGFQDLGAGGISCPTSEMSAKAGTGMRIDVARVHQREPGMEPFEVMISESQERMMAVVSSSDVDEVISVCRRWGLEASIVGEVNDSGSVEVFQDDEVVARVPARALAEEGPTYERHYERPAWIDEIHASDSGDAPPESIENAFLRLVASPNIASKRWVWEQYDHMIFLGTIQGPGGDAAVVRLPDADVAVALSVDGPGRFCYLDPYEGAKLAVAEAARNVACVGARPLAITNCLNFGNPEKPDVMWQFVEVVRGIKDACTALETPVTGGNVSFYNETNGRPIYPTPVIGMLGSVAPERSIPSAFQAPGDAIVLLGRTDPSAFAGSEYAKVINSSVGGFPPVVDMDEESSLHKLLLQYGVKGTLNSAHDLSEGGLAVAVTESAVRSGLGVRLEQHAKTVEPYRWLFSESPTRVIVSCSVNKLDELVTLAEQFEIEALRIGTVGGDSLDLGAFSLPFDTVIAAYETGLATKLSAGVN
jgi:phosphoribosylformylglycinamidine synthase II